MHKGTRNPHKRSKQNVKRDQVSALVRQAIKQCIVKQVSTSNSNSPFLNRLKWHKAKSNHKKELK